MLKYLNNRSKKNRVTKVKEYFAALKLEKSMHFTPTLWLPMDDEAIDKYLGY
jgi:hypothetical protein